MCPPRDNFQDDTYLRGRSELSPRHFFSHLVFRVTLWSRGGRPVWDCLWCLHARTEGRVTKRETKRGTNVNRSDTEEAKESRTQGSEGWRQRRRGRKRKEGDRTKGERVFWETERRREPGKESGRWRERETEALPVALQRNEVTLCVKTSSEELSLRLVIPALINLITAPGNTTHPPNPTLSFCPFTSLKAHKYHHQSYTMFQSEDFCNIPLWKAF